MPELGEWLKSINRKSEYLLKEDDAGIKETSYLPYIINRCLSYYPDLIFLVNEMNNRSEMDYKLQYDFFYHAINQANRFSPWQKKEQNKDLDAIKEYYGYSELRAKEALRVISKDKMDYILESLSKKKMKVAEKQKLKKKEKK